MVTGGTANVLIVDDERYICNIIVEALASEPYQVVSFSDPERALEHIQEHPVDLVLTDLLMGEHSGVQILETTLAYHADASVILMTAHPTVQTAVSVLKKGAYDFLLKPFKLELLRATIKRGLERQRIIRENLTLKEQVQFLKVTSAIDAEMDLQDFLRMVARSCRSELSAQGVGILAIEPTERRVLERVSEAEDEAIADEVMDEAALDEFAYSRSHQPVIRTETVERGGREIVKTFIVQPIWVRHQLHGVINVSILSRFERVTPGQIDVLSMLAHSAASIITNHRLYENLEQSYLEAIRAMANAIEARDQCTAGHTDRVTRLAEELARHLGWDERRIASLRMGCTLHDVGKIGVPDGILNKPGPLTPEEQEIMRRHPEMGVKIVASIDRFAPAIPYIISHHEWYDGSGYPEGLAGEDIPVEGRLLAVVDTVDAILSDRPYRPGATLEKAIDELRAFSGSQFDPEIVASLLELIESGAVDLSAMYSLGSEGGPTRRPSEKARA